MRLLVIRTSAMGDVALVAPVLKSMRDQYPGVELILLTRKMFRPFFNSIDGLKFFFPDFEKRHKGIAGLFLLYRDIVGQGKVDYVIDLHDVIRSKVLRAIFRAGGVTVRYIDKGRKEKKMLITGRSRKKLRHTVERYEDVFGRAGFRVNPSEGPWIVPSPAAVHNAVDISGITGGINIGVAPFAKHRLKMWPEQYMVELLGMITGKFRAKIWLFGGIEDAEGLSSLQKRVPGSVNLQGVLNLDQELALMTKLSLIISMDSSNMHMAALSGTRVVSIWGGTDPAAGFGPWNQPEGYANSIPFDRLTCRPCTVYGKGKCKRKDHACMLWLTPELVFKKLVELKLF
ncbi:MAG: glycosyltransferase family 9 protein [Bacteroidales bacterium]